MKIILKNGFTLVEVLIVVTVLALLAAIALPSYFGSISRNNVRKTSDLLGQVIYMAQSEALRQNITVYFSITGGNLCVGSAAQGCDLNQVAIISGVSVNGPNLTLSPFYGVPSPAPASYTVSYSGKTQTVSVNRLGMVSVGAAP